MLNLNNANVSEAPQMERTLIPAGTVCRAVITVKLGDMEIPEFGTGHWFKASQATKAKWMELEFTVIGGEHDKRKFWDRIFVDGDKMGQSGIPQPKRLAYRLCARSLRVQIHYYRVICHRRHNNVETFQALWT